MKKVFTLDHNRTIIRTRCLAIICLMPRSRRPTPNAFTQSASYPLTYSIYVPFTSLHVTFMCALHSRLSSSQTSSNEEIRGSFTNIHSMCLKLQVRRFSFCFVSRLEFDSQITVWLFPPLLIDMKSSSALVCTFNSKC